MCGDETRRLRNVLERCCGDVVVPVTALDSDFRRIFGNNAFDELVGYDGSEFQGKRGPFPWSMSESQFHRGLELAEELFAMGVGVTASRFRHRSGKNILALSTGTQIRSREGELLAYIVFLTPFSDHATPPLVPLAPSRVELDSLEEELTGYLEALSGAVPREFDRLTQREREVVSHLCNGLAPKEIAKTLFISEHTVRNHVKSSYRKLGISSIRQLLVKFARLSSVASRQRTSG